MAYVQWLGVRFDDVDHAQIVYFPRLFGYCHWVFEDFFRLEVQVPYAQMLNERGIGFPTVHADADFKSPLRFGDVCRIELQTLKLSARSITNQYKLYLGDSQKLCAQVQIAVVAVRLATLEAVPLPEEVRVALVRLAWEVSGAAKVELFGDREGKPGRRLACWPPCPTTDASAEGRA